MANELADATLAAPMAAPAQPDPSAAPVLPSPLDAVQAGQLPAVTLSAFDGTDPLHEFVVSNFEALPSFGLDYVEFGGQDNVSAIFNPQKVSEPQLKAAYEAGQLEQLAPAAISVSAPAETTLVPKGAALAQEAAVVAAPLANASLAAPKASAGLQGARARNLQAIVSPPVNVPSGGPLAANARRAF